MNVNSDIPQDAFEFVILHTSNMKMGQTLVVIMQLSALEWEWSSSLLECLAHRVVDTPWCPDKFPWRHPLQIASWHQALGLDGNKALNWCG